MANYNWSNLSDHDFELVCRDILSEELDTRVEVFSRGPDKGIDLRAQDDAGLVIGQSKHFLRSAFAKLESAMITEAAKLRELADQPTRYVLFTSHELTPQKKERLLAAASPYIRSTADIWGLEEVDSYIASHPQIEAVHYKLWLASARVLAAIVGNATVGRSRFRTEEILDRSRLFVPHAKLSSAQEILKEERALIISGPPGIGKSTMAEMLTLQFMAAGFGTYFVTRVDDIEEQLRRDESQLFVYDDFLGRTNLSEAPSSSDQERLFGIIKSLRARGGKYLILTTREYLYREALLASEGLRTSRAEVLRCMLSVSGYDQWSRARILYNHLYWNEQIPSDALEMFVRDKSYWPIIRHPNFNPRWIADTLNRLAPPASQPEDLTWI